MTSVRGLRRILPKTYDHKREVLTEISTVLSRHQYLKPVLEKFVFNDGKAKMLIALTGTIEVIYDGKRYNIPVSLWLKESYPRTAPICYLKPTSEMVIVPNKHINSSGEIMMPYLDEWRHTQCDLHTLIQVMMVMFSEVPPLRMRLYPEDSGSAYQNCSVEEISHVMLDREDNFPFSEHNETVC